MGLVIKKNIRALPEGRHMGGTGRNLAGWDA